MGRSLLQFSLYHFYTKVSLTVCAFFRCISLEIIWRKNFFLAFNTREELGDRFYNALYSLILRPEMPKETKRHPVMLNLLYRTIAGDKLLNRQKAFLKRLLSVSTGSKTPLQAASLVLLGENFEEIFIKIKYLLAKDIAKNNKTGWPSNLPCRHSDSALHPTMLR